MAFVALLAIVAAVTGWSYSGRLRARPSPATDMARHAEAGQRREAEFSLYLHRIGLAAREWSAGNVGHAERLLDECPPELRGWEWRHLKSLCHRDVLTIGHQRDGERSSTVVAVAYSPDGRHLVSSDRNGDVVIWDADSGRELRRLEGHSLPVRALAFRCDGRTFATASSDDTVRTWDADSGALVRTIRTGGHFPCSIAYSPDGALLATGSGYRGDEYGPDEPHAGIVKLWDARDGTPGRQSSRALSARSERRLPPRWPATCLCQRCLEDARRVRAEVGRDQALGASLRLRGPHPAGPRRSRDGRGL